MATIAFLFPGQGSQAVGMGRDLYYADEEVRRIFQAAEKITGLPITDLCFNGPIEALTETITLQPAITAVNLALLSIILKNGIRPDVAAGHSLGEYSALAAASVVSETDALRLVFERGRLMHRESLRHKGAMAAVIGLSLETVRDLVEQASREGVVAVANHNAEKQIVVTGAPEPIRKVSELAAAAKGKAIPLKVSGAWHSPLIQGAEAEFRSLLETLPFHPPTCRVIHNMTADACHDPAAIREIMGRQLCSPVRWYDTVLKMAEMNVTVYVEIGPGKVLTGLLRKILPRNVSADIYNVEDLKGLETFIDAMGRLS